VHQHERVVVAVDDPAVRGDGLGDLVGAAGSRQPGADVEELTDAAVPRQEPHHPGQERSVGAGARNYLRAPADHLFGHFAVR
jgi:hypothetical protein